MARVPHPAPQRVSAHVVPKAQAFDADDEKTTIESGWEEEPSTTVEQGEVAEKIRALALEQPRGRNNITNITSTNGHSLLEEPTVDDQRAHAAIAMITPPSLAVARLLVTQGNDTGQQLEVAPGKSYTIGRAIDNDFVLTDIAVSRKHFDLRQDAGVWVVADRGSGNGTLVNGNIEDQPFVLANGDLIEIGNTVFRFEQANAPPRAQPQSQRPVAGRYDIQVDEEEPSTVAGKPVRSDGSMSTPAQLPSPGPRLRPKTVPPPAPTVRPRNSSAPPPVYPAGSQPAAAALSSLPGVAPHLQRTAMPPAAQRSSPVPQMPPQPQMLQHQMLQHQMPQHQMPVPQQMLQPATTLPLPQLRPSIPPLVSAHAPAVLGTDPMVAKAMLPTTIPGQGMPPVAPSVPAMPYSYPSIADMHKHGQMLVVGNGQVRDATSTALVQPTPFGSIPAAAAPEYTAPTVSRRTKLLLAGAALTLLAAVATIAIMKGSESSGSAAPSTGSDSGSASTGSGDSGSGDSGSGAMAGSDAARKTLTQNDPRKPDPAKPDPAKPDPAKPDPAKIAQQDPPKPDPAKPDPDPAKPDPDPAKPDPTKPDPAKPDPVKADPPKPDPVKADPPKPDPPKPVKVDLPKPPKPPKADPKPPKPPKADPKPPKVTQPPPRRPSVATADKPDSSAVRNKATELYRAKKFSEAGSVLRQFASTVSGVEAGDLKSTASIYEQLGAAYNRGMSPGAKPADAFKDLRTAQNLDSSSVAGEFTSEIKNKLAQISPKAAISFYVSKEYSLAFQAVRTAEAGGVSNADTKLVRQKLEQTASELYAAASKEIGSNPDAAKAKLRQIKGLVDAKSPILAKATALLNGN